MARVEEQLPGKAIPVGVLLVQVVGVPNIQTKMGTHFRSDVQALLRDAHPQPLSEP